jgi:hypothetical protein
MISTFRRLFSAATSGSAAIKFFCAAIFLACAGNSQSFAITTTAQGGTGLSSTTGCTGYNNTGSTSASGSSTCSGGGPFSATGSIASSASAGHVGASAETTTTGGAAISQLGASAIYFDTFVFHSTNPLLINTSVTLNLNVAGAMSALAGSSSTSASASVQLDVNVGPPLVAHLFSTINTSAAASCSSTFSGGGGCTGSAFTGGSLVTNSIDVPLDMPVLVKLFLEVGANGVSAGASASSLFENSLDFPIGSALFNLAAGVTVNAASSFVTDNVFAPPTSATPLPAALPLFVTGLGALGLLGWRRKKKAALAA